jgi:hypothetical protein
MSIFQRTRGKVSPDFFRDDEPDALIADQLRSGYSVINDCTAKGAPLQTTSPRTVTKLPKEKSALRFISELLLDCERSISREVSTAIIWTCPSPSPWS